MGCDEEDPGQIEKEPEKDAENLPPRSFGIGVEEAGSSNLMVRWSESTDPENSIVKYKVYIAEDMPEVELELVADDIVESQFAEKNREFFFFHNVMNLKESTAYKGKVVAFDQDGNETEMTFSGLTIKDTFLPKIGGRFTLAYRNEANIKVETFLDETYLNFDKLTADFYVDGELVE